MSTYYVRSPSYFFFFFNDTATTEIYTLSLHDALPIALTCSARTGEKRGLHVARDAVEVETGRDPTGAVIWLHGLGADGHDFEPLVPELVRAGERPLRFVFPHAPIRPVTLNGGFAMRAWYDIVSLDRHGPEDEKGIRASQATVEALIRRENERGIASERILLAGVSPGGAPALFAGARYPGRLARLMGFSCFPLLSARPATQRAAAHQATPGFPSPGPP